MKKIVIIKGTLKLLRDHFDLVNLYGHVITKVLSQVRSSPFWCIRFCSLRIVIANNG